MPTSLISEQNILLVHPGEPSPCLMLVSLHSVPHCPPFLVCWTSCLVPPRHSSRHTQSLSVRLLSCAPNYPAPSLPISPLRDAPRPAPPLVAKNKKSEQKKTRQQMRQWNERTYLIFCRRHCSNGRGYRRFGRRINQKNITVWPVLSFETALHPWRYEFETDEELFWNPGCTSCFAGGTVVMENDTKVFKKGRIGVGGFFWGVISRHQTKIWVPLILKHKKGP